MTDDKILILGLGNDILTDDGIGPELVKDLSGRLDNSGYSFDTACCGGLEIIEHIKDYRKVFLIDAIRTEGGKPGNVYHLTPADFRETSNLSNLHDISFLTSIRLADKLKIDIPQELHIIAVEIIEDRVFSSEFTPEIIEKYPAILETVYELIIDKSGI